jgi:hypothetical protein
MNFIMRLPLSVLFGLHLGCYSRQAIATPEVCLGHPMMRQKELAFLKKGDARSWPKAEAPDPGTRTEDQRG